MFVGCNALIVFKVLLDATSSPKARDKLTGLLSSPEYVVTVRRFAQITACVEVVRDHTIEKVCAGPVVAQVLVGFAGGLPRLPCNDAVAGPVHGKAGGDGAVVRDPGSTGVSAGALGVKAHARWGTPCRYSAHIDVWGSPSIAHARCPVWCGM